MVTLKVQSKVEHLTLIAYQLDFLIQNQGSKKKKWNQGLDITGDSTLHSSAFGDQVNCVAIDFDI